MSVQTNQVYILPSGAVIQVGSAVIGSNDEWNCVFKHEEQRGDRVCFTGAFLRTYGWVR